MAEMTRGIRNNNPGNVRKDGTAWRGMLPAAQQTDPAFLRFVSPVYGIRAIAVIVRAYQLKHQLDTVTKIIGRWAPATENDTSAYIAAVAKAIGVAPNDKINVLADDTMRGLVLAIIRHENGIQPYDMATINAGLSLAGMAT